MNFPTTGQTNRHFDGLECGRKIERVTLMPQKIGFIMTRVRAFSRSTVTERPW
jgi:hypothetical protein